MGPGPPCLGANSILPRPPRPANAQLKDLKAELAALRVAKVTGGAPNKLSKM
jgi:hypothetical protein